MKGIHSEIHALAKEISEYCGEPKKFALYLGVIKRIGKKRAYQIFSEIKQSKSVKSPAKLFMFLSRNNLQIETGKNNPVLRKKSQPIKKIDGKILKLAKDMLETMIKNNGIGLSACQIGKNIRMFVVHPNLIRRGAFASPKRKRSEREGALFACFINPKIIKVSKKTDVMEEGCLSLPGIFVPVQRAISLKIKAIDENGKEFKLKAKNLLARVIQHENDHLDGILITDYEPR